MPLLGRHKSKQQQQPQQQPPQQSAPLVCESPLFGVRRQLPVATSSPESNQRSAAGPPCSSPASPAQATTATTTSTAPLLKSTSSNSLASHHEATPGSAETTANDCLSSIPKQISRQQIHYAFSIMDTNSDGLIDLRDLSQMLANLGVPIDEAILSHVMSSVSTRGDHLIKESEFLDWIGNVIQVSDLLPAGGSSDQDGSSRAAARGLARKTPVGRSSSAAAVAAAAASASLAAHSPEAQMAIERQMRQRRGSGSGLALMRSLSSSSSPDRTTAARGEGAAPTTTPKEARLAGGARAHAAQSAEDLLQLEQQQEACSDLKAAFCVFDLDGDGFITIDEVQQGLKLLGEAWSQQELNQVFSKCSGGGGGSGESSPGRGADKKQSAKAAPGKQRSGANDLTSSKQRISIDDFVRLLL